MPATTRSRGGIWTIFPAPEEYHADPDATMAKWLGTQQTRYRWPETPATGPAFRPEQHRWQGDFPYWGSGALNRLVVHSSIVDFMERALATTDIRLYQTLVNAKYTGCANYEQPMHTDRNHSWLPSLADGPRWHVENFLYLCDVEPDLAPTHLVANRDARRRSTNNIYMPADDPALYACERPATGVRGSLLAYRSDVFHRGVDITRPGGARFLLNMSYKLADADWVGYHAAQSRATHPHWVRFVEGSTPRELELFGFPPPGHPVWTDALTEATAVRYPKLDLTPWRTARAGDATA